MEENTNCQNSCKMEEEKVQPINPQPQAPLPPPVKLNMTLNPIEGSVEFIFVQGETKILQMKMRVQEFERMTIDMIKTVKEYNLYQANVYQQKIKDLENEKAKIPLDNAKKETVGIEGSPEESANPFAEEPQGTAEVVQ